LLIDTHSFEKNFEEFVDTLRQYPHLVLSFIVIDQNFKGIFFTLIAPSFKGQLTLISTEW